MRRMLMGCLFPLILAAFLGANFACAPAAQFELGALTISPPQVIEGSRVTASIEVTNAGEVEGTFQARLMMDDILKEIKYVPIAAGEKKTISFTIDEPGAGAHSIKLNSLAGTFGVLTPPTFAELAVSPSQVEVGEEVAVSAVIGNNGTVSGNYTVGLNIDGAIEETKTVGVNADSSETVRFQVKKSTPGTYSITVGNLSGNFTVLKPAIFTISNLVISPEEALPGREVSITCSVTNSGEVDDSYPVALTIDGMPVDSQIVTVPAGSKEKVTFSFSDELCGSYDVAIGDLSGTLVIAEGLLPPLYAGDSWIFREVYMGIEHTRTETILRQEYMEGKACYVMRVSYDPPMDGWIYEETRWIDKATHYPVFTRVSGTLAAFGLTITRTVSYSGEGANNRWPYQIGNEFTVRTSWVLTDVVDGETFIDRGESATIYHCVGIEDIMVEAGTFRCFKTVEYENYQPTYECWYSDKVKTCVKTTGFTNGHIIELISYSVN